MSDITAPAAKFLKLEEEEEDECRKHEMPKKAHMDLKEANKRFFRSLEKKCNNWVNSTPFPPSFCLLYTQDGKEMIWNGPEHMCDFAQHQDVVQLFKETSLKRNVIIEKSRKEIKDSLIRNPIELKFRNPRSYTNDVLAKIIPRILNPYGKRNFYSKMENKPKWFPTDVVFRRPNHPKEGEKRMSVKEMVKILKAFMVHCPQSYKIIRDEEEDEEEEEADIQTEVPIKKESDKNV